MIVLIAHDKVEWYACIPIAAATSALCNCGTLYKERYGYADMSFGCSSGFNTVGSFVGGMIL